MFNALFDALEVRPVILEVANISDGMTALSDAITLISSDHKATLAGIESVIKTLNDLHTTLNDVIQKDPQCCADVSVRKKHTNNNVTT